MRVPITVPYSGHESLLQTCLSLRFDDFETSNVSERIHGNGLELTPAQSAKKTPHLISQDSPRPLLPLPTAKVLAAEPAAGTDP
jgi:hypothetical protein